MNTFFKVALVIWLANSSLLIAHADLSEFDLQPENKRLDKRYIARDATQSLSIYDTVIKKTLWKISRGGTGYNTLKLAIGPDAHYGIVTFEYGVRGQSLYWVDLTRAGFKGNGTSLDLEDRLTKLVAKTIKVPEEDFSYADFRPKKWLDDTTCALVWESMAPTGNDHDYGAGVVFLSFNPRISKSPILKMGNFRADMSFPESYKVSEKDWSK